MMTAAEIIARLRAELAWVYDRLADSNSLLDAASDQCGADLRLLLERVEAAAATPPCDDFGGRREGAVMVEVLTGRELDAAVAELVMGITTRHFAPQRYSTDIAASWQVVEKMHARGEVVSLSYAAGVFLGDPARLGWECRFRHAGVSASSANAPEAICRAALAAVKGGA